MPTQIKINMTCLTIILSSLGTAAYIIWIAGAKARDIEVAQVDINSLKGSVVRVESSTTTLEERSKLMLDMQRTMEARLHGIATQIGLVRSDTMKSR